MSKVLEFPTEKVKEIALNTELQKGVEELEELYDILDVLHGKLHDAENDAEVTETRFNKNLREYAGHVGIENVPVHYMQYCSEARISVDADNVQYTLDWGDENETER
jgi:hypothetical protein